MTHQIETLEAQKKEIEKAIMAAKIAERASKPKPRFIDGMGVIEQGFYGMGDITRIIAGSGMPDHEYYGLELMRGCKHCMKYKYSWSNSNSWLGYAIAVTERYLRRYYPKTIFYDESLMKIINKLKDRFDIYQSSLGKYIDHFRLYEHQHEVIFKGRVFYLEKERYKTCTEMLKINAKLKKTEVKYNEAKAN